MNNIIKKDCLEWFDIDKNYKLYRTVYELMHPSISRKNITDYQILLDDKLVPLRIFYPDNNVKLERIIIYIHGGIWNFNKNKSYSSLCSTVAKTTKSVVFAIDYRISPQYKFPTGFMDCFNVIKHIYETTNPQIIDSKNIIIMGDSLGASIATGIALKIRDEKNFKIEKQILLYPTLNNNYSDTTEYMSVLENNNQDILTRDMVENFFNQYIDKEDYNNKYAFPLLESDLSKMPKTLLITGDKDLFRDEGYDFASKLKKSKNKVIHHNIEYVGHDFLNSEESLKKEECLDIIRAFVL